MKRVFTILAAIALFSSIFAQVPEKLSYQAVIRNSIDQLVTNQQIGMQISILKGSATGTVVYIESQTPTTNANGLVTIEIGEGTTIDDFSSIEWSSGPYFIKTETDPTTADGTSYTITGTSQLLSVPYALHAKTAESVIGTITENDPEFTAWDKSTGISITENQITDLDHFTNTDETDPIFSLSVAEDITAADTVKWNDKSDFSGDYNDLENKPTAISEFTMNANSQKITNLANPVNPQDAVTKAYVTLRVSPIEDTLFFGSSQYVIIPGISSANPYGAGNNPPNTPTNLSPADGATVQPIALSLEWSCSDPDGDPITYDVYIDTVNASTLVASNLTGTLYSPNNLQSETIYYWKVLATDDKGITSESEVWSFITLVFSTNGTVTDIDSNIYLTAQIGNQIWMVENLKVTHYANGTEIPLVTSDTEWAALEDLSTNRAYCWYDDDISNKNTYGALYSWAAVINGDINHTNIQGVCPDGWHVPNDLEWVELENYLADNGYNYDGTIGGGRDKIAKSLASTEDWAAPSNTTPYVGEVGRSLLDNNRSGFTALPGGRRLGTNGLSDNMKYYGCWWSANGSTSYDACYRFISNSSPNVYRAWINKSTGFSVRCVKDN